MKICALVFEVRLERNSCLLQIFSKNSQIVFRNPKTYKIRKKKIFIKTILSSFIKKKIKIEFKSNKHLEINL